VPSVAVVQYELTERSDGHAVATNGHHIAAMAKDKTAKAIATTIYVDYDIVGGWHVFRSEQVRGLYVAHADQRTAFEAIGPTIEKLLAENEHVDVEVRPAVSFETFFERLRSHVRVPEITPGTRQQFMVMATS